MGNHGVPRLRGYYPGTRNTRATRTRTPSFTNPRQARNPYIEQLEVYASSIIHKARTPIINNLRLNRPSIPPLKGLIKPCKRRFPILVDEARLPGLCQGLFDEVVDEVEAGLYGDHLEFMPGYFGQNSFLYINRGLPSRITGARRQSLYLEPHVHPYGYGFGTTILYIVGRSSYTPNLRDF